MGWSRNALAGAAGALGAVALLAASTAVRAQDEAGAEAGEAVAAPQAQAASGTPVEQYRSLLRQIDDIRVYNSQMQSLIASQEAEIQSMTDQVGRVEIVERGVTPLMLRMVDALEQFVELDVPFQIEDRKKRIAELSTAMNQADLKTPEKFRRILEAYQIENEYGRTIDAYRSTLQKDGKELTVDFLRFGRIALVYQSLDESELGAWNQQTKSWDELDASYRSAIRQGLRIARKQAAPDLVRLPLPAASASQAGEEG